MNPSSDRQDREGYLNTNLFDCRVQALEWMRHCFNQSFRGGWLLAWPLLESVWKGTDPTDALVHTLPHLSVSTLTQLLSTIFNLQRPWFPQLGNEDGGLCFSGWLWELNEGTQERDSEWSLVNVTCHYLFLSTLLVCRPQEQLSWKVSEPQPRSSLLLRRSGYWGRNPGLLRGQESVFICINTEVPLEVSNISEVKSKKFLVSKGTFGWEVKREKRHSSPKRQVILCVEATWPH